MPLLLLASCWHKEEMQNIFLERFTRGYNRSQLSDTVELGWFISDESSSSSSLSLLSSSSRRSAFTSRSSRQRPCEEPACVRKMSFRNVSSFDSSLILSSSISFSALSLFTRSVVSFAFPRAFSRDRLTASLLRVRLER